MAKMADPLDGYVTKRSTGKMGAVKRRGKYRARWLRRRVSQDLRLIAADPSLVT